MSTQSLPVNTQLIAHVWEHIARDSGFKPGAGLSQRSLELTGFGKWLTKPPFIGIANVRINFLARPYQLFLNEISVVFTPDQPKTSTDYRMLKGETLMAFYHQRLVLDFMPANRPCPFVITCPQSLVVLLARHNFVSSISGYPIIFTSLGKTNAE